VKREDKGSENHPRFVETVPTERIERLIFLIRGQRVILGADLAALYGVVAWRLNEQVNNPALPGGAFVNQVGSFLRFATGCHSSPLFRAGHPGRSS
jgi:hypothetical protein